MVVNLLESSKHSWDSHESCILVNVAGVGPHVSRRWFHVPLVMVQPILDECVSVVKPSCVITEKSSIISSYMSDFCCIWTHPRLSMGVDSVPRRCDPESLFPWPLRSCL